MKDSSLRNLKLLFTAVCMLVVTHTYAQEKVWAKTSQPLKEMKKLKKQIKAPNFKNADYSILDFGAKGDGKTDDSEAIKKAIETCNSKGGGRVIVPAGTFLTAPIYLKSNVNLHLEEGSTILFSRDPKVYPLVFTRWEGMECMNYSAQFYAYQEENIAITGSGLIDGNANNDNWWNWNGSKKFGWEEGMPKQTPARDVLHEMMHKEIDPSKRIFGEGHWLRPNMFQPYYCKNVWVQGVKMVNSPMWFMNPVLCENVLIDGVKVQSHGPNNDGCDPEACKNVWIKNCFFDTGDDCIAIKSGRDEDGRRIGRPAENHIIENCEMKDGHGGVVIGSEIAGGARNIYAMNCIMDSPNLDRILRLKTSSSRGGVIENVFMKDMKVGTYKIAAVSFNMFYEKPGNHIPTIRNIWVENLDVANGGQYGIYSRAYESSPVQNLKMINCNIKGVEKAIQVDFMKNADLENVWINGEQATINP